MRPIIAAAVVLAACSSYKDAKVGEARLAYADGVVEAPAEGATVEILAGKPYQLPDTEQLVRVARGQQVDLMLVPQPLDDGLDPSRVPPAFPGHAVNDLPHAPLPRFDVQEYRQTHASLSPRGHADVSAPCPVRGFVLHRAAHSSNSGSRARATARVRVGTPSLR